MGQTAAIWSCREDVVAIVVGQCTMIRPIFTRRFWTSGTASRAGYDSKYVSHELSDRSASQPHSMAHRMGFRKVKDPYGMSVLETNVNESEEKIIKTQSRLQGEQHWRTPKRAACQLAPSKRTPFMSHRKSTSRPSTATKHSHRTGALSKLRLLRIRTTRGKTLQQQPSSRANRSARRWHLSRGIVGFRSWKFLSCDMVFGKTTSGLRLRMPLCHITL
jgi:hypothetical protein